MILFHFFPFLLSKATKDCAQMLEKWPVPFVDYKKPLFKEYSTFIYLVVHLWSKALVINRIMSSSILFWQESLCQWFSSPQFNNKKNLIHSHHVCLTHGLKIIMFVSNCKSLDLYYSQNRMNSNNKEKTVYEITCTITL